MSNASYYLYQKYIKYGTQDFIPVYPAEYAISGDSGQDPVIKQDNDPNCGYCPAEYRWHTLPIGEGYVCSGGNKYYKEVYQVSNDCGFNWENTESARTGSLYESGSSDCIEYRWVNMDISTDWVCSGTSKYYKQKKQWKYTDSSTWADVVPPEYQMGALYESASTDCGYIPPQYRWVVTSGYACSGTNKMTKEIEQVSYDSGTTWQNVVPEVSRAALPMIESASTDCGYIPTDYSKQYLTFIPISGSSTFGWITSSGLSSGNTVYYSLDSGSTWSSMTSGETVTVNNNNKIYWKADSLTVVGFGGKFTSTGKFDVEGNIMSLISGDSFTSATALKYNYQFYKLFSGNTNVVNAENLVLPATTLKGHCYQDMFNGCTSLKTAPSVLPATTLLTSCYEFMFYGCTSLTTVPIISATTMADYCCLSMFYSCRSLTTVPSNMLPSTTLANYCYQDMFYDCRSLTTAPELPATTLAEACYQEMFRNCFSLKTSPVLPAATLVKWCYNQMFRDCSTLNSVTCLATNISATDCTSAWLQYVSSSGTFTKAASMSSWTSGANGIPNNWSVQNA